MTPASAGRAAPRSPLVVLVVLSIIALYAWSFTHAWRHAGLPSPREAAAGALPERLFRDGGNADSALYMSEAHEFADNEGEMLAFYILLAEAFLFVYFLPGRLKRDAIAAWTVVMIGVLYGPPALAVLLAGHCLNHALLHRWKPPGEGLRMVLAHLTAHSLLIGAVIGSWADAYRPIGELPLGPLLFFGHWMRLLVYLADYKEGRVPKDLSLRGYLASFLTPGEVPNWFHATLSQGYAYVESVYLRRDENKIILGGARLLLLAFLYLVFGEWLTASAGAWLESRGVAVYGTRIQAMTKAFALGEPVSTASVLGTTLLALFRFTFYWGGVSHFKIGVWRLFGFDADPHFQNWLLSTDLSILWRRYTFHYREFLARVFYYPVFFRLSHWPTRWRMAAALIAAAGIGNMVWGHACERVFYDGFYFPNLTFMNRRWPYFALLSAAMAATQAWQAGRPRRQPWTPGWGLLADLVCAALTVQFYALLHVFAYPAAEASAGDLWRLFFRGLGFGP